MGYKIDPLARYGKTHEWVRLEGDLGVVGVSDYAQHSLSDVVYVELPEVGAAVKAGQSLGTIESVKAAEDAFCPVSGTIVAVNTHLEDNPELLNEDPYGEAWLVKIELSDPSEIESLMDGAAYEKFVEQMESEGGH